MVDYSILIHYMPRVLRQGGLAHFVEWDYQVWTDDYTLIHSNNEYRGEPWLARWFGFVRRATEKRGGHVEAANHLGHWLRIDGRFENVREEHFWIYAAPSPKMSTKDFTLAIMMRDNLTVSAQREQRV